MKNGTKPVVKTSKIARQMNKYILITMCIQILFSLVAGSITALWTVFRGEDYWYIYPEPKQANSINLAMEIPLQTGVWFIALMNFVPVSLLVTLEMINVLQAYFISVDIDMCDEKTGITATV